MARLNIPDEIRDKIDTVIDAFDATRIHKVMTFLNWKWFDVGVPSEFEIRKFARNRLYSVWENYTANPTNREYYCESGGIRAIFSPPRDDIERGSVGLGQFQLLFILTSAEEPI